MRSAEFDLPDGNIANTMMGKEKYALVMEILALARRASTPGPTYEIYLTFIRGEQNLQPKESVFATA